MAQATCTVVFDDGTPCSRPQFCKTWCRICYNWSWRNSVHPMGRRASPANGDVPAHIASMLPTMTPDACITEWPFGGTVRGRPAVFHDGTMIPAVRYAWMLLHGRKPHGQLNHTCRGGGVCWNPHHVYEGSQRDNMLDMWERGERPPHNTAPGWNRALSSQQADAIRRRYAAGGVTQCALAEEFGVSPKTIFNIVHHRIYVQHR